MPEKKNVYITHDSIFIEFKEMQTNNTLKYHYTPIWRAKSKIMTPPMGGEDHSYNTSGNVKWYSLSEKWLSSFFKN